MEKRNRIKSVGVLAWIAGIPFLVIWLFAWVNMHEDVLLVQDGTADLRSRETEEGPFLLAGRWSRVPGSFEPEDVAELSWEEVEDIRYIRRMRGYTYTFLLETDGRQEWSFLLPRPHSSRLWLNGVEVTGEGGDLSAGEIYRLSDYTKEQEIRVVLQVTNSSIYDVYQGILLGSRAGLSRIQYRWMALDWIAAGLSVMLILMCLMLFLPKRSERYLLLLAASTLVELAHFLLIPRHPGLAFFHLGTTAFYRQLGFIHFYVVKQFVPGESSRFMDIGVPAAAVLTAAGCLLLPQYSNQWIQASFLFYMLVQAWILARGVWHGAAYAPVILTGCMLALGNELFYRLLYAGKIPQGQIDIELMPAQYMRFAYIATFAFATCMKYGRKFCEADSLSADLEKKVREQTEKLRRSNAMLVKTQENRQQFLTDMVHNLRSPLFAIGGYLDLLRDEWERPEGEQEKYLDLLDRKTEYLGKMVDDMFLSYRLEEGQLCLEQENFELGELLQGVGLDARVRGQEKGVRVEVSVETSPCFLPGDRFRLKQALDNILDNALRYSPPGGVICIRQVMCGRECVISICDQGPGIPKEQQERLFERYKSKGAGGKNGLGLSISSQIVQLHGGRIEVVSEEGQGTEIRLLLPGE